MLSADNALLLVIDVQEKLSAVMYHREELIGNLQKLVKGVQVLNIPIIVTEQYPKGLGPTVQEIAKLLPGVQPLSKLSFSCTDDETFTKTLKASNRKQILISGIECHICIYQTARDLIGSGYEVYVITDTVSSRTLDNREIGLSLMRQMGAVLTGTETVLFEMLKIAKGESFKAISQIVK